MVKLMSIYELKAGSQQTVASGLFSFYILGRLLETKIKQRRTTETTCSPQTPTIYHLALYRICQPLT